jgi:hypothetical protein
MGDFHTETKPTGAKSKAAKKDPQDTGTLRNLAKRAGP